MPGCEHDDNIRGLVGRHRMIAVLLGLCIFAATNAGAACAVDGVVYCGFSVTGSTDTAGADLDGYSCTGSAPAGEPEAVYVFHTQQTGIVEVLLSGMSADHDVYVLEGACDASSCIEANTDEGIDPTVLTFFATEGTVYFVVVEAVDATGSFDLEIMVDGSGGCHEDCDMGGDFDGDGQSGCDDDDCRNDPFCQPRICTQDGNLDCSSDPLESTVGAETGLLWYPCGIATEQPGPENLHGFMAQKDGVVSVILDGQTTNHDLFLLTTPCEPLSCIEAATNPGTGAETLFFDAVAGETYYLAVEAQGGPGDYTLDFLEGGGCPEDCDNGIDDDLDGDTDCDDSDCSLDLPCTSAVFEDGFESGDTSAWSAATT